MAISPKMLTEGEHVILNTRTHWKALVPAVIWLVLICGVTGFLLAILPSGDSRTVLTWIVIGIAVIAIGWLSLKPFVLWLSAEYTITNRRVINRSGIITRVGRDIPLYRINDVSYERGLLDRMLGCGTLVISVANEEGNSTLFDVPRVEQVQTLITDLLFSTHDGADSDGTRPPEPGPDAP